MHNVLYKTLIIFPQNVKLRKQKDSVCHGEIICTLVDLLLYLAFEGV